MSGCASCHTTIGVIGPLCSWCASGGDPRTPYVQRCAEALKRAGAALALALLLFAAPGAAETLSGPALVVDGDTLKLGGEKIRLHGIDAPEKDQTCRRGNGAEYHCGARSLVALEDFISGRPVRCEAGERDRYQRLIARCYLGTVDLGAWMVAQGHAVAFTRYSAEYVPQEKQARARRLGIWAGTFAPPAEYRKGVR